MSTKTISFVKVKGKFVTFDYEDQIKMLQNVYIVQISNPAFNFEMASGKNMPKISCVTHFWLLTHKRSSLNSTLNPCQLQCKRQSNITFCQIASAHHWISTVVHSLAQYILKELELSFQGFNKNAYQPPFAICSNSNFSLFHFHDFTVNLVNWNCLWKTRT